MPVEMRRYLDVRVDVEPLGGDEVLQHIYHQILEVAAVMLAAGLEPHRIAAHTPTIW
jgi:hypothetical protein